MNDVRLFPNCADFISWFEKVNLLTNKPACVNIASIVVLLSSQGPNKAELATGSPLHLCLFLRIRAYCKVNSCVCPSWIWSLWFFYVPLYNTNTVKGSGRQAADEIPKPLDKSVGQNQDREEGCGVNFQVGYVKPLPPTLDTVNHVALADIHK